MRLAIWLLTVFLLHGVGPAQAAKMRGLLIYGHEARTLQLCGDTRVFWVQTPAALHQELETAYRYHTKRTYEPVYVELEADFSEYPAGALAADYDGTILIRDVEQISAHGIDTCATVQPLTHPELVTPETTMTYVLVCDEKTAYTVRASETKAWIFHPKGTRMLSAVSAARDRLYSDGSFELRIDGQQAQLGEVGSTLQRCQNDPRRAVWERAKLDGADFRAVGNEAGWTLAIMEGSRIVLSADYGASRVELPLPSPLIDQQARTTRWDAGEFILEVIGRPCRDSMSGESFEASVVVTWGARTLRGCGRALH